MYQLTNLAFLRAPPGPTQALGSALSALVALLSGDPSNATGTTHSVDGGFTTRLTVRLRDLRNGLPNEPPMGMSAVRPGYHPARTLRTLQ